MSKQPLKKDKSAVMPTLKYSIDIKANVIMGPNGFKLEWEDDMQVNLAALLIAKKIMDRVKTTYEYTKANTRDAKMRKDLIIRLPRIAHTVYELSNAAEEMYVLIAAQQIKLNAEEIARKKDEESKK